MANMQFCKCCKTALKKRLHRSGRLIGCANMHSNLNYDIPHSEGYRQFTWDRMNTSLMPSIWDSNRQAVCFLCTLAMEGPRAHPRTIFVLPETCKLNIIILRKSYEICALLSFEEWIFTIDSILRKSYVLRALRGFGMWIIYPSILLDTITYCLR